GLTRQASMTCVSRRTRAYLGSALLAAALVERGEEPTDRRAIATRPGRPPSADRRPVLVAERQAPSVCWAPPASPVFRPTTDMSTGSGARRRCHTRGIATREPVVRTVST